jgi:hypothetical protein
MNTIHQVFLSGSDGLARLINLDEGTKDLWQAEELGSIWRHQLNAPLGDIPHPALSPKGRGDHARALRFPLPAGGEDKGEGERQEATESQNYTPGSSRASGPKPNQTFRDLFQHQKPSLGLLREVKDFGKAQRNNPESSLPQEIATLLYHLSIVVALVRCRERITTLSDKQIREGIDWALAEPWVDERTRALFHEALRCIGRT